MTDENSYQYKGIPLTPAIVQVLIRKLFAGKLVERQTIIDEVLRIHLAGGGLKASAQNLTKTFNNALTGLKDSGLAENTAIGYWRIEQDIHNKDEQILNSEEFNPPEVTTSQTSVSIEQQPIADIELGTGSSAIYVYYLPTYKLRAQDLGEQVWPCKIGRTDRDPLSRVLSQAATALPEKPRIAIILRTSHPSAWESALHGVLTLRGLQIESSPGVEWFLTSPNEIIELIKSFDPKIADEISSKMV